MMNIPYHIGGDSSNGGDVTGDSLNTTNTAASSTTEYHNLDCTWTIWVIDPTKKITQTTVNQTTSHDDYLSTLDNAGSFSTVEDFWAYYHKLKLPSKMPLDTTYHLFKSGISPTWEDPINVNGGKWVLTFQTNRGYFDIDLIWENLVLGIVGETIDTERDICGIVFTKRDKIDRIAIWNRDASNPDGVESLRTNILNALPPGVASMKLNMKYQTHNLNNSTSSTHSLTSSTSNSSLSSYLNTSNSNINTTNNNTTNNTSSATNVDSSSQHENTNNNINTNQQQNS